MKRCFSATNPQHAPFASRHALGSGRHTASRNAQPTNGGTAFQSTKRIASVRRPLSHDEKKFSLTNFMSGKLHLRRALYQFMKAEIARLMVRYAAMMIATPSIACPV